MSFYSKDYKNKKVMFKVAMIDVYKLQGTGVNISNLLSKGIINNLDSTRKLRDNFRSKAKDKLPL